MNSEQIEKIQTRNRMYYKRKNIYLYGMFFSMKQIEHHLLYIYFTKMVYSW